MPIEMIESRFTTPHYSGAWFQFTGDRHELRKKIETHLRLTFQDDQGTLLVNDRGPFWQGSVAIELSYAHTHFKNQGAAVLVYSQTHRLGVDLERTDRLLEKSPHSIAERYFHPDERSSLSDEKFLNLWLKKEAYAKFTREGLKKTIHLKIESVTEVEFSDLPVIPTGYQAIIALQT
jgi:phosphopantetheinyl transferase